jgi:hypothetical protein
MNGLALSFIEILRLSIAKRLQHEIISEGFIDVTVMGTINPHSTAIATTSMKALRNEERELHTKVNGILQFF